MGCGLAAFARRTPPSGRSVAYYLSVLLLFRLRLERSDRSSHPKLPRKCNKQNQLNASLQAASVSVLLSETAERAASTSNMSRICGRVAAHKFRFLSRWRSSHARNIPNNIPNKRKSRQNVENRRTKKIIRRARFARETWRENRHGQLRRSIRQVQNAAAMWPTVWCSEFIHTITCVTM